MEFNSIQNWSSNFSSWRSWLWLGFSDLKNRYLRTRLGFIWSILPLIIYSTALSYIFQIGNSEHSPRSFLNIYFGLIIWNLISGFILEGLSLYSISRTYILNTNLPLSFYVFRLLAKNLLHFLLLILIGTCLSILLLKSFFLSWTTLIVLIPVISVLGISLIYVSAYFNVLHPDFAQLVQPTIQVLFIVTPIFWSTSFLSGREWVYKYNPLYWIVELVRKPLQGEFVSPQHFIIVLCISTLMMTSAIFLTKRSQTRIPFKV